MDALSEDALKTRGLAQNWRARQGPVLVVQGCTTAVDPRWPATTVHRARVQSTAGASPSVAPSACGIPQDGRDQSHHPGGDLFCFPGVLGREGADAWRRHEIQTGGGSSDCRSRARRSSPPRASRAATQSSDSAASRRALPQTAVQASSSQPTIQAVPPMGTICTNGD